MVSLVSKMPKVFRDRSATMSFLVDTFSDNQRSYYHHDDRGRQPRGAGVRKPNNNNFRRRPNNAWIDDDIDMGGRHAPYNNNRGRRGGRPYNRPRGGGEPRYNFIRRDDPGWFKVEVMHGKHQEKAALLKSLNSMASTPFVPFNYHIENQNAVFFVETGKCALALRDLNRKVLNQSGQAISIKVTKEKVPIVNLEGSVKEKLTQVMSNRYDTERRALNLSNLSQDSDLKGEGLFVPLSRPVVMNCVCNIILEHIPEIEALDLSRNGLMQLDQLSVLKNSSVRNLNKLNLDQNMLKSSHVLEQITCLPLVELSLLNNSTFDRMRADGTYTRIIRKKFPRLVTLDGKELPPVITFDLEESKGALPPSKPFYAPSEEAKNIVGMFVEQYYKLFDSDNRQSLLDAYHDTAMFSYVCTKMRIEGSRNLLKVRDFEKRNRNLKQGKLSIVSCLCDFPSTQHDFESFSVDIALYSSELIQFTIHGVFKDTDETHQTVYNFWRTFVLVPVGTGFCVVNETWSINNATVEQIKAAFKAPAPTPSPSPTPQAAAPALVSSPVSAQLTPQQQQMVLAFSKESNMNAEFSLKCLSENGWNWEVAGKIFTSLHSEGKIPPEAFVH